MMKQASRSRFDLEKDGVFNLLTLGLAFFFVVLFIASDLAKADDDILQNLKTGHPRLLLNKNKWEELRARRKNEMQLDQVLRKIEADANWILLQPALGYKKEGKRLLAVSREAIRRILDLSVAYKLSGSNTIQAQLKQRAETELLALASFRDWNPSHFLDVAEMTTALALGYDWLYDDLSSSTRNAVRSAILEKGLKMGDSPSLPNTDWYRQEMNWNQVCLSGLALGALAIADEKPDEARKMLKQVQQYINYGLKPYEPEGVYPEGPTYWGYGTTYQVILNSSLQTALGTDWNLGKHPGFSATPAYITEMTSPSEKFFNYSDGGEKPEVEPAMYQLARELKRPDLLYFQNRLLNKNLANPSFHPERFFPLIAIWLQNLDSYPPPLLPLNWHAEGGLPLAVFRSSWSEPTAFFLAVKGGSASLNHAHMDTGSFVLDRDGVRWGLDLGAQDYYSLESKNIDLWNRSQDSQRWDVFRIGPFSHNTLTIGNKRHQVAGQGKMIHFKGDEQEPGVDLDLSSVFLGQATKVVRSFSILNHHNVQILDSLEGVKTGEAVRWNFTTKANVTIQGPIATLKQAGQTLRMKIVEPTNSQWNIKQADPPPHDYDAKNPGVSLLSAEFYASSDQNLVIKILVY